MKKFEFFDVTADIGFYAYGNNLNEAFENAGLALFNIISKTEYIEPITSKSFEITSEDKVSLLYDFLEELLFLHEIEFMLFSQFKVTINKTDDGYHLNATIEGVVLRPSVFAITTGLPPSITATHEFVVPKSIPIIFPIVIFLS